MTFRIFDNFAAVKEFCTEFDSGNGCTTSFTRISLNEIRQLINKPYEYYDIQQLATIPFENRNTVFSNDIDIPESPLGKLNSLFLMAKSIRAGKRFFAPMSIHVFPTDIVVHPGNTRLMFSYLYLLPVDLMITDYTNSIQVRQKPINYDPTLTTMHFNDCCDTTDRYIPKHLRGRPFWFKQMVDHVTNTHNMSFHVPRTIDPPRKYEKIADTVLVNGDVILREINGVWKVVLE
jgi:hypothetical protein